jgi:hypothetical protein
VPDYEAKASYSFDVKAADPSGAFNSQAVTVNVSYVGPSLAAPIPDRPATEGAAFAYVLPAGTFTDDDALALSATLSSGAPLPAWLTFDPATGTFAGTPPAGFTSVDVKVMASDGTSSASDVFTIRSSALAVDPTQPARAQTTLPTQQQAAATLPATASQGQASTQTAASLPPVVESFDTMPLRQPVDSTVPVSNLNPFAAPAPVADLNALPATGAGAADLVGFPLSRVSQDGAPQATLGGFTRLALGSDQLFVYRGIPGLELTADGIGSVRVPEDAFAHTDPRAIVQLEARLTNGMPLPAWLEFGGTSGLFRGTPPDGMQGSLEIEVIARDTEGREAHTTFVLRVEGLRSADRQQAPDAPDIMLGLDVDAKEREKARLAAEKAKIDAAKGAAEPRLRDNGKPDSDTGKPQKERAASFTDQVRAAKSSRDPLLDKISRPDPNGRGKRG